MGVGCDLAPTPRYRREVSKAKRQAWTPDPALPVPVPHNPAANRSRAGLTDLSFRGLLLMSKTANCRESSLKVARITRTLT